MKRPSFTQEVLIPLMVVSLLGLLCIAGIAGITVICRELSKPIQYKNEKSLFGEVSCNGHVIRQGFLHESGSKDTFIVRNFRDYEYPRSMCSFKVLSEHYE